MAFTVIFPGYPSVSVTQAHQLEPTKWQLDLGPFTLRSDQFTVALSAPLPPTHGIIVFVSAHGTAPGTTGSAATGLFEQVGTLTAAAPSAILRFPRAFLDAVGPGGILAPVLGFAAEPVDTVTSAAGALAATVAPKVASSGEVAKFVARDLHTYVLSHGFADVAAAQAAAAQAAAAGKEVLVMPANVVDSWLQRFEARCARDPDFLRRVT
eukprot:TRINITY_DN3310_c0_g1_i1.p1 TRINITY_DN3310_c0_g1~~TRINITY_DN3310_c0_g1_i1.p1  ORF type:complete len:210 (-),score=24.95 TRINITY_DN3310_c0_g1_i1:81-710(-)